ncbi:MAG: D-(-)-3-hydroxybutyrate oligomer hydrolase [Paraburkholderia sp.]|jgi:hydroxybutyrate-dimer hydrolase|nr:D-(-)-3-hydroxybutyrate oligomer hydrolase [Paraburkholderia sp.]
MKRYRKERVFGARTALLLAAGVASAQAAGAQPAVPGDIHVVKRTTYDGVHDDLITGGIGMAAMLSGKAAPSFADPLHPTAAELRRAVLLKPGNPANGFGTLYGPNVNPTTGELYTDDARLAGEETIAWAQDKAGHNTGILLQIPASFNAESACLVVIPTPGSQNYWNDMQRAGYWGLRHGCALAWTDKGTGAGIQDLDSGSTVDQVGTTSRPHAGVRLDVITGHPEAKAFARTYPHRIAFKWANSGWNQEAEWGHAVLEAAAFGLAELESREWPGKVRLQRDQITVIASGFSNGGGAVLRAAEQDSGHLLDGVVALAPQVHVRANPDVVVEDRGHAWYGSSRSSYDFLSYGNLYQACAALAVPNDPGAAKLAFAQNRCASLAEKGLLHGTTVEAQAKEALDKLHRFGFLEDADIATSDAALDNQGVLGQASQFGEFRIAEHLCNLSFAAADKEGLPVAASQTLLAQRFSRLPGGTPNGVQVSLINDADPRGPHVDSQSVSRSTGRNDYDLDAALCLRNLFTGDQPASARVRHGIDRLVANARLNGTPTIIVHGRSDDVEGPNFSSRPYVATESLNEPGRDTLRYMEIEGGMHGEGLISSPGFDVRMVPVSVYQIRALEAMYAHLKQGKRLPDSQVVHTTPRTGTAGHAAPTTADSLPPFQDHASDADRIVTGNGVMRIPS